MRSRVDVPVHSRRPAWIGIVVAAALMVGMVFGAQARAAGQQQNPKRTLGPDAGLVQSTIKADRTADFEMVMGKVKEALQKSDNPLRKRQAAGWKVFKATEKGPGDSALYFFVIDPAVGDADYTISTILSEGFPAEAQQLYDKFSSSYAGGLVYLNLQLIESFDR